MRGKIVTPNSEDTPVTLAQLIQFLISVIHPDFVREIEDRLLLFRVEFQGQLDSLFKNYEDLSQEYAIICEQLKGIDQRLELIQKQLKQIRKFS